MNEGGGYACRVFRGKRQKRKACEGAISLHLHLYVHTYLYIRETHKRTHIPRQRQSCHIKTGYSVKSELQINKKNVKFKYVHICSLLTLKQWFVLVVVQLFNWNSRLTKRLVFLSANSGNREKVIEGRWPEKKWRRPRKERVRWLGKKRKKEDWRSLFVVSLVPLKTRTHSVLSPG